MSVAARRFATGLLVMLVLAGCGIAPGRYTGGSDDITPDMLINDSPLSRGFELADLSGVDILAVTPEMEAYLGIHIAPGMSENSKIRQLLLSVVDNQQFRLVYDDSAAETFRDGRGNCLSFTNLFVAMARYVGLDAKYQEVEIPPDWSLAGHALLLSRHVNAFVDLQQYTDRVVDFNTEVVHFRIHDLKENYQREIISDRRARAHYFNNIGVEYMLTGGDTLLALANLQQGAREDATFAPVWISLGLLHRREGFFEYAEAAYRQALEVDATNLVAMSNLASLYEEVGRTDLAALYRQKVESHRMSNPYYRYALAEEAFASGDYAAAIDHLSFAVRKRKDEDRFYFLLSLSYMMSGSREEAQHWMQKAEEVAAQADDRKKYQHKLEMLMEIDPTRGG